MPKYPLDINRKLRKYGQNVKVMKRGVQVRKTNFSSKRPDFGLGCYEIKPTTQYSLIINVDLPKKSTALQVDFYGLTTANNLQHLTQSRINLVNRDVRVKFHTYPKTRWAFMTFKLLEDESEDVVSYNVNYVYLDAKTPIPKNATTPAVPNSLTPSYNIECNPHILSQIDLESPFSEFMEFLPIDMNIFEHSLILFLLGVESSPSYLKSLKANISYASKTDFWDSTTRNVETGTLKEKLNEIKTISDNLDELLSKVDNLQLHKQSLETIIRQSEDGVPYSKEKRENYIKILQRFKEGLAIKTNYVNKLAETNEVQTSDKDRKNVQLVLDYYKRRIESDRRTIQHVLEEAIAEYNVFSSETLKPIEGKQNTDQVRLDKLLVHYRTHKVKAKRLKEELDAKIVDFLVNWYQWIKNTNQTRCEGL